MKKAGSTSRFLWARVSWYLVGLCCLCTGAWSLPSTCSADDLFVGSFNTNPGIYEYDATTGAFIAKFGTTDTFPLGAAFGPSGSLFVSDSNTDSVLRFDGTASTFASSLDNAAGVAFGTNGNLFVVSSSSPGLLTELNGTTGAVITASDAGEILMDPEGVTRGPDGNIYVAGGDGNNVLKFNGTTGAFIGTFVTAGAGGLQSARGVAFGPDGNLYVTSFGTNQVLEYNGTTGAFIGVFASGTGACSGLSLPRDLTFGPNNNLFVSSYGSGDVFEFNGSTGACVSDFVPAGTGGLGSPTFVVFGQLTGGSSSVPEPSSLALAACGLAALAAMRRRRNPSKLTPWLAA